MQGLRQIIGFPVFVVALLMFTAAMLPEVTAMRFIVGGNKGWTSKVNYATWARKQHFYKGDWLFFVYDRSQMNVLEVTKKDYDICNAKHPVHNWTTGAGRDVVTLKVTKTYYFISGRGFCHKGVKVAVQVKKGRHPLPL